MGNANGSALQFDERLSRLHFSPINASFRLYGYVDGVHGRCVDGWIFDAVSPTSKLTVDVYDGATRLGSARAGLFRADLDAIGIANGDHAFRFELPAEIFDGNPHEITVRLQNSDLSLPGSPRRLSTQALDDTAAMPMLAAATAEPAELPDRDDLILRSLHAITEALIAQTGVLQSLLGRASSLPPPTMAEAQPPMLAPAAQHVSVRAPAPDPRIAEILDRPVGQHDYIVFGIIDWSFRTQRPQHLATRLAEMGNRVFYVGVTFAPLQDGAARFEISAQPADGVFEIRLCCRDTPPVVYNGFDDPDQLADLISAMLSMVATLKLQRPVCLVQLPSWYPIAGSIPGASLIFDCLDHLAGFSGVAPKVVELEQKLIEDADSVVVTSDFLADMVGRHRSFDTIRNAVDVRYFSQRPETVFQPDGHPVIGYFGAIAEWFDMELVAYCARRHPKWQFVLIGAADSCDVSAVAALPNVTFLGEKPYADLTHYLYAFDVCLIPFKLMDLTRATNPVKVYEYLCAGKPVVATDLPELRRLPPNMVELAHSPAEFDRAIVHALRNNKDPAAVRRRQGWAARHSWDVRARKLAGVVARQYPPVSIVVVCYNNLAFTRACLKSLLVFSDYPDLEIICVDNGSTDGTGAFLDTFSQRHPSVRVVHHPDNLGFAAGNNAGMREARGEFVVLLNNDTYVTQGWVRDLIRPMLRYPDIGMTGPLTNMTGNEQKIAIVYSNMEEMAQRGAGFTAIRRRHLFPVGNLAFFCVAIRRQVIDKVGALDESYGTGYFEDDDYCMRVRDAGYRLVVCDDVFIHHHHSASFNLMGESTRTELMKRNRRTFEKRWGRWTPHKYRQEPGFGEA